MSNLFDITSGCMELKKMEVEQKRLQGLLRDLKKKKTDLEVKIQKYLAENQHKGVMINDVTILNECKTRTKPLPKKEKEERLTNLLKQHNINPELVQEFNKVTKGTPVEKNSITINYVKQTK
jgi:hypothetical protein